MAWQDPNNDQCNDFIAALSQTGWGADSTAQSLAEYGAAVPFLHQHYPASRSEELNPNDVASSTEDSLHISAQYPNHQAEVAGCLAGVDGPFGNGQSSNTCYFSPGLILSTTERSQDASSSALPSPVALARSNTQRKARLRQPGSQEWERHKDSIHDFYLKQNFSLETTIKKMEEVYQFCASKKMYKDKFKQWKWSKNLPRDVAIGMLSKANRRHPKETIFHWNNQAWPIKRIMISYARCASDEDLHIPEDCPTPPGVTCETPRLPDITDNPNSLDILQEKNSSLEPVDENSPDTTKKPYKSIDEGPFHIKSVAEVRSVVQSALDAGKEHDQEEAESALRNALSCSSHLLSPTHSETLKIGYLLASFYGNRGRMDDADDILNWMTRKHVRGSEACNLRITTHLRYIIALLRFWRRTEEADILTYRLLESHTHLEERHFILQSSSGPYSMSNKIVEDLLSSSEPEKLAAMQDILELLVSDSNNHELLRGLLPRYIETCDKKANGKLTIRSRCILANIWVKDAQFERAKGILRQGGDLLRQQVATEYPLEPSTLKLAQRVAFTFLEADDPDQCVKLLEEVEAVAAANISEAGNVYGMQLHDFLISTAFRLHKRSTCERSRPWFERALLLSRAFFGQEHERTKRTERVLETCRIDSL